MYILTPEDSVIFHTLEIDYLYRYADSREIRFFSVESSLHNLYVDNSFNYTKLKFRDYLLRTQFEKKKASGNQSKILAGTKVICEIQAGKEKTAGCKSLGNVKYKLPEGVPVDC